MQKNPLTGVLLDENALSLEEMAQACAVETQWIIQRVEAGILHVQTSEWRFTSTDLIRARNLLNIEQNFEADRQLAALVVDLMEEVDRLKRQMRLAGLKP